jgi:hypothetical protein
MRAGAGDAEECSGQDGWKTPCQRLGPPPGRVNSKRGHCSPRGTVQAKRRRHGLLRDRRRVQARRRCQRTRNEGLVRERGTWSWPTGCIRTGGVHAGEGDGLAVEDVPGGGSLFRHVQMLPGTAVAASQRGGERGGGRRAGASSRPGRSSPCLSLACRCVVACGEKPSSKAHRGCARGCCLVSVTGSGAFSSASVTGWRACDSRSEDKAGRNARDVPPGGVVTSTCPG